ncbi:unnamed protein product [Rangifer tarandus platyrhynchus]|uniref:Uncharacterized protein n=1 Tax=Rangifer tarandus platyrhynchus TaxID=3082113 RepID=A0ABN8YEJ4_RANTA|nr:unnamed protein product [Rangifer tarandus platyrhynchus]
MAVGSLVDTRPALRKARPQRCGRGGQTQEAVRKAAISGQRPWRRRPRKTAWSPHGPARQQGPGAGRGRGGGRFSLRHGGGLRCPSFSPRPAERGAQTATPPGTQGAPASRIRKPCAKSRLAPPRPLRSVSATSWESVISKGFKNHQLSLQSVSLSAPHFASLSPDPSATKVGAIALAPGLFSASEWPLQKARGYTAHESFPGTGRGPAGGDAITLPVPSTGFCQLTPWPSAQTMPPGIAGLRNGSVHVARPRWCLGLRYLQCCAPCLVVLAIRGVYFRVLMCFRVLVHPMTLR